MTKAAVSGGTTFLLEESGFHNCSESPEDLYCDLASIHLLNDSNLESPLPCNALALKAYIFQPGHGIEALTNVRKAVELASDSKVALFLDPNLPDPRMLYMASPLRLEKSEEHKEREVNTLSCYAAAFAQGNESDASGNSDADESLNEENASRDFVSLRDSDIDCLKTLHEKVIDEEELKRLSDISSFITKRQDSLSCYQQGKSEEIMKETHKLDKLSLERLKSDPHKSEGIRNEGLKSDSSSKSLKSHKKKSSKDIFHDLNERVAENSKNIEVICMAEKNTYQFSGNTQFSLKSDEKKNENNRRRPPMLAINAGPKPSVKTDYTFYLANCPESWETEGVEYILSKIPNSAKIHFQGISSASAINKIRQRSETFKQISCEIPAPHLFFNNSNIGSHDTRFKSSPPIRNSSNFNLLLDLLKMRGITSISSQHSFITKSHKALETQSFQNALGGLCSLGFTLQSVWSTINIPISKSEQLEHYLVRLSKWFSVSPAKILGLSKRGSISKGKFADLVVWTPYCRTVAKGPEYYKEMSIFDGKELFGVIHKVYLRGNLAFDNGEFLKAGRRERGKN
jgi:hypothetical protein